MAHVKDMDSLQLSIFLMEKNLANETQAKKFVLQDIDGQILLGMSADQITTHVGYSFGNASRMFSWLRDNSNQAIVVPNSVDLRKPDVQGEVEMRLDKVLQKKLVVRKVSSSSSQRIRVGTPSSQLPPDPVTDVVDVQARIFGLKPAYESSDMWGKRYLESYQPRAHAAHNRNIERMRGFFTDVYNPVVRKAWTSNFKVDKTSYNQTVEYMEQFCVPELEDLDLMIQGVSMQIPWKATDIMKGWFLDHKKHYSKKRKQRIASLEAEDLAFLQSIPKFEKNILQGEDSIHQFNVHRELGAKLTSIEVTKTTSETESLSYAGIDPNAYTNLLEKKDSPQPTENLNWLSLPLNSPEVSKTEILGEESPISDGFEVPKTAAAGGESQMREGSRTKVSDQSLDDSMESQKQVLGGGSHIVKNGPQNISGAQIIVMGDESESFDDSETPAKIVSRQRNQSSDDLLQPSPEHKRQRKTPLLVGSFENRSYITRCAKAIVLGGESRSLHDSQVSKSQGGNQSANNFVHLSPQHKIQSKVSLVVGRAENGPSITQGAKEIDFAYDLHVMPGLRRKTDEPLVSSNSTDPSTDAHSPNHSLTSTETTNSTKLIQPKKAVSEFYDTQVCEPLKARRSNLPKQVSKSLKAVVAPCPGGYSLPQTEPKELLSAKQKMSNLGLVQNSRKDRNKENVLSASMASFTKGKLNGKISKPVKALGIDDLDEDSKLTIAYKAMKLSNKKEVKPQLKSYMAAQNQRVLQLNEHASGSDKIGIPFSGHKSLEVPALLNLLVKWALEFKVKIVNPPKPMHGKIRLFAQHVQDKENV